MFVIAIMRWIIPLLLCAQVVSAQASATVSANGVTYVDAELIKEYPQSVYISHASGKSFVKKTDLSANDAQALGVVNEKSVRDEVPSHPQEGDLLPEVLDATVVIQGKEGSGSGFVCSFQGKNYIVSNQHVVSGLTSASFQTRGGIRLLPTKWLAASDVDLVIMEVQGLPPSIKPLELLEDLSKHIAQGDKLTIPGNSEGDGVVTQTHGQLLAIGGQRIETDCPVYPGNSGSPIIHRKSGKVIGVLTEAERLIFDEFTKHSFKDKKSAIKSEVRYFGYRLDTVSSWRPTTAVALNNERSLLDISRQELDWIAAYFTGASDSYKEFTDLHVARNEAHAAYDRGDLAFSEVERARQRFLWKLEGLIERATKRIPKGALVYVHQEKAEAVKSLASNLATGVDIVERDDELTVELIKRGL